MTDIRKQMTDVRKQMTDIRRQMTDNRRQMTEDREQMIRLRLTASPRQAGDRKKAPPDHWQGPPFKKF